MLPGEPGDLSLCQTRVVNINKFLPVVKLKAFHPSVVGFCIKLRDRTFLPLTALLLLFLYLWSGCPPQSVCVYLVDHSAGLLYTHTHTRTLTFTYMATPITSHSLSLWSLCFHFQCGRETVGGHE